MIRKLSAGLMPPPGAKRPERRGARLAHHGARSAAWTSSPPPIPIPGRRTFQRLNRPEYERAIADLLALDVDAANWLPLDQKSANFDNIADEQGLSPTLLEAYLNAAGDISRMAVGDRQAARVDVTYTNPSYVSQHPWDHVEGAPYGTRGGMVVNHVFPADAEYEFELLVISGDNARGEDIDVSIDGQRVALLKFETAPAAAADGRGGYPFRTEPLLVRAGEHKVAVAFVKRTDGPYEDLIKPHEWSLRRRRRRAAPASPPCRTCATSSSPGPTTPPASPRRRAASASSPAGRRQPAEERTCARSILTRLAGEAYRRPLTAAEVDGLMPFYEKGAEQRRLRGAACARRSRRCWPARTSSSAWSASARPPRPRARPASPTSTWRRGCRSSCGARRPTRSCWRSPRRGKLQGAACSRSRPGGCSPTRAPRRSAPASPRSGCGCRTSTRSIPIRTSSRTSTRTSPTP